MNTYELRFIFLYAMYDVNILAVEIQNNVSGINRTYLPLLKDLDTRPLPQWYDSAKIGIFIHWGVYSVPSYGDEWFQFRWARGETAELNFIEQNYDGLKYEDFAQIFSAAEFDPNKWARLFVKSGAKYVVLTSKHHDGFTLFPSSRSNWNSVDVGPKRDIVKILSESIRDFGMKFGIYYSLLEWFNSLYVNDIKAKEQTTVYTDTIVWPDVKFLVENYKPSLLWFDGDQDVICGCFPSTSYWKTPKLLAWLYNESPVKDEIVVNDRWGNGTRGKHGDFYNHDDRFNPRKLMSHKWENAFSLDRYSWGYRHDMRPEDVLSFDELLETVVSTVSCGGNVLINIGPTKEGVIAPLFEERLHQLGDWLKINGEAIYNTLAWVYQRDSLNPHVWFTCNKEVYPHINNTNEMIYFNQTVYAIFLKWPDNNKLRMKDLTLISWTVGNFEMELKNPYPDDDSGETNEDGYTKVTYEIFDDVESGARLVEVDLPKLNYTMEAWILRIEFHFFRVNT